MIVAISAMFQPTRYVMLAQHDPAKQVLLDQHDFPADTGARPWPYLCGRPRHHIHRTPLHGDEQLGQRRQ